MTKREEALPNKRQWLAWTVTIFEALLLGAFAVVLSRYWLMLPVWMRRTAGLCLTVAFLAVAYRLFRFIRRRSNSKPIPRPALDEL